MRGPKAMLVGDTRGLRDDRSYVARKLAYGFEQGPGCEDADAIVSAGPEQRETTVASSCFEEPVGGRGGHDGAAHPRVFRRGKIPLIGIVVIEINVLAVDAHGCV
jgi:hypothetical protein